MDVERRETTFGGPRIVGDHGDRVIEPHHLSDTGEGLGLRVVHAGEFAAEHRAGGHARVLHSGNPHIDAVLRRAVHLVRRIEALDGRTDQPEVLRLLELDVAGQTHAGGSVHQRPIVEATAGRVVDDGAVLGVTCVRVDLPRRRRGGDEHLARGGARPTEGLEVAPHRCRASRFLYAEGRLRVPRIVRGRVLEAHLAQVHLELFGQEHGHRGVGSLPHLDLVHHQGHEPIGVDANECVGGKFSREARGHTKPDQERAAGSGADLEEGPAGQAGRGLVHRSPWQRQQAVKFPGFSASHRGHRRTTSSRASSIEPSSRAATDRARS